MDRLRRFVITLDAHIIDTPKKRHIVGGILMSASIFLGALAVTVISTKIEENNDEY